MNRPLALRLTKLVFIIALMGGAIAVLPDAPVDPWGLVSLKKIMTFASAITLIQLLSVELARILGHRHGAILTGLLGGFVSSTATVLTLARASKHPNAHAGSLFLTYIASTIAMQLVCVGILFLNTQAVHYPTLLIMLLPVLSGVIGILIEANGTSKIPARAPQVKFEWDHVLKLVALIVLTLVASKTSQLYFQESGAMLVTFVVSLFEMHGSVIANLQLHDAGAIDLQLLGALLSITVFASFTSKLFFVVFLGGAELKSKVVKYTALSYTLLAIGWMVFTVLAIP